MSALKNIRYPQHDLSWFILSLYTPVFKSTMLKNLLSIDITVVNKEFHRLNIFVLVIFSISNSPLLSVMVLMLSKLWNTPDDEWLTFQAWGNNPKIFRKWTFLICSSRPPGHLDWAKVSVGVLVYPFLVIR